MQKALNKQSPKNPTRERNAFKIKLFKIKGKIIQKRIRIRIHIQNCFIPRIKEMWLLSQGMWWLNQGMW
jgi:hypothetical protein